MKPRLRLALIASAVLLTVIAGIWLFSARQDRAVVARHLPQPPHLGTAPQAFHDAVNAADIQARTFGQAAEGLRMLAQLYHANGHYDEALQAYAGLRVLSPKEPRWHHLPAMIHAGYGQSEEAIALWERTLELAPDYPPARLRLADLLFKTGRVAEAATAYEAALRSTPGQPYAQLGLARIDLEAGRLERARERLEGVLAASKGTLGYDLIVTVYERLGQSERALALRAAAKASGAHRDPPDPWVEALIEFCYDPYQLALAAGILVRDAQPEKATELLWRAINLAPEDVSSRFQLALLARERNDIATAREQLHRCTTLAPGFADGWYHLSALQYSLGERDAAARTLAEGLRRCPDSPGLHLLHAQRLLEANRIGEAITALQTSIRLRPNEPEAYLELGQILVRQGREDDAIVQYRKAWEVEPGNPAALAAIAFYAITRGDDAEARLWMERVSLQPRLPRRPAEALRQAYQERFGARP